MDLSELETEAKLKVKIGRTLLRAKLIMTGNVLLTACLFAYLLLCLWYVVYLYSGPGLLLRVGGTPFGVDLLWFQKLNLIAMTAWKLAAYLLLLCPGLACRVCGGAMKP